MKKQAYSIALFAIATAGAVWFFQSRAIDRQKKLLIAEQDRMTQRQQQLTALQRQRDDALLDAENIERNLLSPSPATGSAADSLHTVQAKTWLSRATMLRQSFSDLPDQAIPELQLLADLDWLTLARKLTGDSELDLRKARSAARALAIRRFTRPLGTALQAYTAAHEGILPDDIILLAPYFPPPVDLAMLQRYTMTAAGNTRTTRREAVAERSPIDEEFDSRTAISATGSVSTSDSWAQAIFNNAAFQAGDDFALANGGRAAENGEDLLPYVHDPALRTIFSAIDQFRKNQSKNNYRFADLRPYVTEPNTAAFLERLIVAEQQRGPP